jgi:predicted PurR-regulated permease PerM
MVNPITAPLGGEENRVRSVAMTCLAVIAVLYTLYFARVVLIPFTVALLLNLLFAPLVKRLKRLGIPTSLSAAAIIMLLILRLTAHARAATGCGRAFRLRSRLRGRERY